MEEALIEIKWCPVRQPEEFTRAEFQERFKLTQSQANKRLGKLRVAGKVERRCAGGGTQFWKLL